MCGKPASFFPFRPWVSYEYSKCEFLVCHDDGERESCRHDDWSCPVGLVVKPLIPTGCEMKMKCASERRARADFAMGTRLQPWRQSEVPMSNLDHEPIILGVQNPHQNALEAPDTIFPE